MVNRHSTQTGKPAVKPGRAIRHGVALLLLAAVTSFPTTSPADEGGVSFWLPGQFGSLAAVPAQPGWSFTSVFYFTNVSASGAVAASRQITLGRFNPTVNVDFNATLRARIPADFLGTTYVFATPVLGGQLAMGLTGAFGLPTASINGILTASVGGFPLTRFGTIEDSRMAFADLYPMISLRWNHGVHNFMIYGTGDIPVGTYDPSNLANLGIGHGAADGGIGYTYFNPATGHEFSAVTGVTYNFRNTQTDYQNGIDWHLDWGASQFLSKQMFVGLAGYFYQQLTADRGQSPLLGDFKSRVIGVGPQVGYIFPVNDMQGVLSLKTYYEFAAENRPSGWNTWVAFQISPAAPGEAPPTARRPMITK